MSFHRLTVPSYTGGLPGGYDYINNAISGTPALADGARADSGPNNGTYFVGTGENARGPIANRGLKALAQNCDQLDDYLRRDLAISAVTTDVLAGAPVSSVILAGPVFIGVPGTPNTVAGIRTFLLLVDDSDNVIYNTGVECQVTAISPDVPGNSWSAGNITLTVVPAIPSGTTYRVYYFDRSNLATLPENAFIDKLDVGRYNGGPNWADGTTNPPGTVGLQLDKIVTDLAGATGANKIGYDGGPSWTDAVTNPATTVGLQLDKIVADLADPLGFGKIGATPFTPASPPNAYGTASNSVGGQIIDIVYALNLIDDALSTEATNRGTADTTLQTNIDNLRNDLHRVRFLTAAGTLNNPAQDKIIILNPAASFNLQLSNPALSSGHHVILINGDGLMTPANKVTLVRFGSEKINNLAASFELSAAYGRWTLVCDGTNWHTV